MLENRPRGLSLKLNSLSLLLTKLRLTLSLPGAEQEEDVESRTAMNRDDDWDPDSSLSVLKNPKSTRQK